MIADMKKLLLFGNNSEKSKLLKLLHKNGCVEVSLAKKFDSTDYIIDEDKINEINKKLAQLDFVFSFLEDSAKVVLEKQKKDKTIEYKQTKTSGLLKPKMSLTYEEFASSDTCEAEVFDIVNKLDEISDKIVELRQDSAKAASIAKQLAPYKEVTAKLTSFKDTKNVSVLLGSCSPNALNLVKELEEKGAYCEVFKDELNACALCVIVLKEKYEDIVETLSNMEFSNCTLNYSDVAKDLIENADATIEKNEKEIFELQKQAAAYDTVLPLAQRMYDYYLLEKRKVECEGLTSSTQSSYFMEAWLPSVQEDNLTKSLNDSKLSLAFVIQDPQEGDVVPSYCENNEVIAPYESVTNMFSAPAYKEIDPNPFVAFFFFVFYGMMLSDAGYGLVLTLLTAVVLIATKPKKGQSNLIKVVFMGGISTMIWGVVFGSYFGISATDIGIWCWFNPIEEPMMMLYLSLGMGIFQMLFGTIIKAVACFKKKEITAGIASFCWLFLVMGIAGFACPMFIEGFPAWIGTVGIVLLALGVVMLMASGAIGKKGAAMVSGAFASLYDVINFFSDLMSYTRIFGLGLATAVIGMVFNQIGTSIAGLVGGGFAGVIIIAIIAIIGHTFNIAINALGAYVHNARLQFVEFFGKFYEGGGSLFKPLGSEMKYYYINNDKKTQEVKE